MNIIKNILILIISLFIYITTVNANIDLTVSPIKYEIVADKWNTITKTATLLNRSEQEYTIITWKSDFESKGTTWNPHFVKSNKLILEWQSLSEWVDISTESFIIKPWETKEIEFTITIPEDATPGWHYWAIFFKNNNSNQDSWSQISVNVDYWVLLLIKVNWEIITKIDIDDTLIINPFWLLYKGLKKDQCFIDLTPSLYDWRCIQYFFKEYEDIELNSAEDSLKDFEIIFNTLFKNIWNTHIKPYWRISLIDENWKEIKWIWKEIIKNEAWAIIWEKIVDYLPINDNGWNILPWTNRNYQTTWKWFPYESYDKEWKIIIKYWSPEEFYTRENIERQQFLLPWERINEKRNHKKLNALVKVTYKDKDWENVEFNSAQELYVDYKEKYVWLNPYVFIYTWIIIFILFIVILSLILIFRKKKYKCQYCKKTIEKDMILCPYCGKKQKKIKS